MIELLNIPKQCVCNRAIPITKIFSEDQDALSSSVSSISWQAVLRPDNFHSDAVVTDNLRYEEIQVVQVEIADTEDLFSIARAIYRKIMYPCLLLICYKGENPKYTISACRFSPGKQDYDKNVLHSLVMSHWIHPDCLSNKAKQFIDSLNHALDMNGNLYEIYSALFNAITMFRLGGTSQAHTKRLVDYICGKGSNPKVGEKSKILRFCTPYRFYPSRHESRVNFYSKNFGSMQYSLINDYEDIWYCFMKNDYIRGFLENNRYRDIDDLVYHIDEKYYESQNADKRRFK